MSQLSFTTSADRKTDAAALLGAFAFTGSDKTLPMLMSVQFEWNGQVLSMAATDRYSLGVFRLDLDPEAPPAEPFTILIDRADVKRVAAMLKAPTRIRIGVTFTIDTDTGTVEVTDYDGSAVRFRVTEDSFPTVRSLLPGDMADGQGEPFGISAANLTRVAAAGKDKHDHATLAPGTSPNKPIRWVTSIGYGLLMPIRLSEAASLPDWAGAPAAASAAA